MFEPKNSSTSKIAGIPPTTSTPPVIPPHKIVFSAMPTAPSTPTPPPPTPEAVAPIPKSEPAPSTMPPAFTPPPVFTAPPPPPSVSAPSSTYVPGSYTPPSSASSVGQSPNMRSFAYDIKSAVDEKGVDMAHIIMSESRKREALGLSNEDIEDSKKHVSIIKIILITFGVIALLGGVVALFLVYSKSSPVIKNGNGTTYIVSPFVRTEKNAVIDLRDNYKTTLLDALEKEKQTEVADNTLRGLAFREESDGLYADTERLLLLLEATTPETLLRALDPRLSFGLHGTDKASYLILKSTSYDNAYAGMIEWEDTLAEELGPLFFEGTEVYVGTTTVARDGTKFTDKVYFNIDTRAILGEDGNPIMLWAILNRTYIVIARDAETFEELIKRMTTQNIVR